MLRSNLDKRWRWSAGAIAVLFAMPMTSIHGARAQDAPVVGQTALKQAATVDLGSAPARPTVPMPRGFNFNRPAPSRRPAAKAAPVGPGSALLLDLQAASVSQNGVHDFPPDGDIATSQQFTVR